MSTDISLRQRPSLGLSETVVRRLQAGAWLIVLALAIGLNVVMLPEVVSDSIELTDMDLSPAEQASLRQHIEELGSSLRTFTILGIVTSSIQEVFITGVSAVLLLKRKGTDWFAFYLSLAMIAGIGAM